MDQDNGQPPQNPTTGQQPPIVPDPAGPDWQQGPNNQQSGGLQPGSIVGGTPSPQPPVQPMVPQDNTTMQQPMVPQPPQPGGKKKRLITLIVVGIVALAIIAVAYVLFFSSGSVANDKDNATQEPSAAADVQAVDIATLNKATVNPPSRGMVGYVERDSPVATIRDFRTEDGTCELLFGTATDTQAPGADLNALVETQLAELRKQGAALAGPEAGAPLTLKDASDSSVAYSLPTINYMYSIGVKHAAIHYSAAVLKNGDRVVVSRTCNQAGAPVAQSKLAPLDAKANQLTITKQ